MAEEIDQIAEQFERSLQRMEQSRDVEDLADFFAEDAVLGNLGGAHDLHGRDGARVFWSRYLEQFNEIHSEFSRTTAANRTAILEWESKGSLRDGHRIDYRGVTILRLNEQGKVGELQTYYDSAVFVVKTAGSSSRGGG